jgi:hypothetical protein
MKTARSILSVCLAVVCVAGSLGLAAGLHANRVLREANRKLAAELREAQGRLDALLAEKQETARQLALGRDSAENLQNRMAEVEAAKKAESEAPPPVASPYQAQAYLGQESLGWAWIVPRNYRKDTNTQRYVYEPVVCLDENLRKRFVIHYTNVVEREIESRTYINNTYYPQPVYYTHFYPRHYRPLSNSWTSTPRPPVPRRQADVPAATIKMRPQVLGTPASQIKPLPQSGGTGTLTP